MTDIVTDTRFTGLRGRVQALVEAPLFQNAIIALICINAVTLGMETSASVMAAIGPWLLLFDGIVLGIFVIEILLKLFAYRLKFFRSGWNWFDLIIVSIALMPSSGPLSVLRALRILRVLRLLSLVPSLRNVIGALFSALPGMGAIVSVLLLLFYVAAVIATKLYGATFPEWFGTIGASMYSLFQIMTLESWSMGIVRPVMEVHPQAWIFFVPFVIVTSFAVLNLFIGIIVNSLQRLHDAEQAEQMAAARELADEEVDRVLAEVQALRAEVAQLAERMPTAQPGKEP